MADFKWLKSKSGDGKFHFCRVDSHMAQASCKATINMHRHPEELDPSDIDDREDDLCSMCLENY